MVKEVTHLSGVLKKNLTYSITQTEFYIALALYYIICSSVSIKILVSQYISIMLSVSKLVCKIALDLVKTNLYGRLLFST